MRNVLTTLRLPVYQFSVSGTYSKVERPTGLQYLLLTIIDADFTKLMVWKDVIRQFRIPVEVFESILVPELRNMSYMLEFGGDRRITLDSRISDIRLTPEGHEALGKEILAEKTETFNGKVVYIPCFNDKRKFSCSTDILNRLKEVSADREGMDASFDELDIDSTEFALEIENVVRVSKSEMGIDDDSEILTVEPGKAEGNTALFFNYLVNLRYDEKLGTYSIDSSNVDDSFIKAFYDAEYILSKADPGQYEVADERISPREWREQMPDADDFEILLPSQLRLEKTDHMIVRSGALSGSGQYAFESGSVSGLTEYDMIVITPSRSGYGYYFVERQASISGIRGSVLNRYVLRVPIGPEECQQYLIAVFDNLDIGTDDGFDRALGFIKDICDGDYIRGFAERYLSRSKNLPLTVNALKKYNRETWFTGAVETVISDRITSIAELDGYLSRINTGTDGSIIYERSVRSGGLDRIQLADLLLFYCKPKNVPSYIFGLKDDLCRIILGATAPDGAEGFRSTVMNSIISAANNLGALKSMFGIISPSEYSFDLTELAGSAAGTGRNISMFLMEIERVEPYINGSSDYYREIKRYCTFFEDIRNLFDSDDKKKVKNARLFGIENGILLESILKRITGGGELAEMLQYVKDNNMISESDYRTLDKFRLFRNTCAHEFDTEVPDVKTMKRWEETIDRLKQVTDTEGDGNES